MKATASSWKRLPFVQGIPVHYAASFDEKQLERLKQGLIPAQMEDKWFVYFEEPHLFFHRSWTGQPIYRVTLQPEEGGARVAVAAWAEDVAKTENADPAYQAQLLDFLVSNLLLGQSKPFPRPAGFKEPVPGMFQHHVSGTGYLEAPLEAKRSWWKLW